MPAEARSRRRAAADADESADEGGGAVDLKAAAWWSEPAPASTRDLAGRFESLGDNCELAAFQLHVGADRLAFFRWSSTSIPVLVRALEEDLAAGIDKGALRLAVAAPRGEGQGSRAGGGEYIVENLRYGTQAHAFAREGEADPAALIDREHRRLTLLRRKFLEDAAAGRRIYVYRSDEAVPLDDARALLRALRAKGPNALLLVQLAGGAGGGRPGEVRLVEDGLAIGYIDVLAPANDGAAVRSQLWPLLLDRAWRLFRRPAWGRARQLLSRVRPAWTR